MRLFNDVVSFKMHVFVILQHMGLHNEMQTEVSF